jgi:hypothetical protein
MLPEDLKVFFPQKTPCIASWGYHPWAPQELGSSNSLTCHLQVDDELDNLRTPTPRELTFDDPRELYIIASQETNKFCSPRMWLVPWNFNHLGSIVLNLPRDLILVLPGEMHCLAPWGPQFFKIYCSNYVFFWHEISHSRLTTILSSNCGYLISMQGHSKVEGHC